jgi:hypothetical protein
VQPSLIGAATILSTEEMTRYSLPRTKQRMLNAASIYHPEKTRRPERNSPLSNAFPSLRFRGPSPPLPMRTHARTNLYLIGGLCCLLSAAVDPMQSKANLSSYRSIYLNEDDDDDGRPPNAYIFAIPFTAFRSRRPQCSSWMDGWMDVLLLLANLSF